MSTPKKTEAPFVKFVMGADEIGAANALREAKDGEVSAAVAFYRTVIVRHDVDLSALKPRAKDAPPLTNAQVAARDFVRHVYAVMACGEETAKALFDANVKGDAIVQRAGLRKSDGRPYAAQAKRQVIQTIFGSDWSAFVKRMAEIDNAGEEADAKRDKPTPKSDAAFVLDRVGAAIARMRKAAEKLDGTVPYDAAPKLAKELADVLARYGIK